MAVKLKDVARKAGVSPTTVSLVFNQGSQSRISQATRERILEAAQELGYQPGKTAQRMAKNITQPLPQQIPPTIALVITDITNPFFTELAAVIEDVASRYGYNIILCNTKKKSDKELEYLEVLWRRRVDGLIIAPAEDNSESVLEFLKRDIPVVFVDRYLENVRAHAVLLDNVKGTYMAVEYLIQLGHRRIGIINGRREVTTGKERLLGYTKALADHQIELDERLLREGYFTIEGGQQAMAELLDLPDPPSAIFSSASLMTMGALQEIQNRGMKLPQDLSLASFDDYMWTRLVDPPLTVVAQPVFEIGKEAAQLIIQLIQGWGQEGPKKILLQPELIVRASCRAYSA
ncbi:MAG: LacI family DNA-binding transcriptional regulator [Candidatus Vecturithrix sp.]|jgi:LacI family transcriptional regulator|nr:LacI family DNA-binding transcriptional regulator [Candidatus Vecturithrix sp.]